MDPQETLRGTSTESVVLMRAHMASDLADAGRIVDQVKVTAPFARIQDPDRLALFHSLLDESRRATRRAAALLMDETFLPRAA